MFGKKAQPPIKSLIAQGSRIEGNLKFTEGLRVDGEVLGNIQRQLPSSPASWSFPRPRVVAGRTCSADHVIINGTVRGPVHAQELLELQPKARIEGDVYYKALEMHRAPRSPGSCRPMDGGEEKPLLKLAANSQ